MLKVSVRKLNRDLDQETMERQSGDRRLKLIIDDEAETREEGDIALGEEIDREAEAREKGDQRLGNALADEKKERMEADEALQEQIDSIETGAVKVPIFFTSGADQIQSSTNFGLMGIGHLKETGAYWIITPMSGEISDLIGYSIKEQDLPAGQSISFTLYVNGEEKALSCLLNTGDQCTNYEDAVPVTAGDKLAILVTPSSASITASEVGASVVLAGQ